MQPDRTLAPCPIVKPRWGIHSRRGEYSSYAVAGHPSEAERPGRGHPYRSFGFHSRRVYSRLRLRTQHSKQYPFLGLSRSSLPCDRNSKQTSLPLATDYGSSDPNGNIRPNTNE